MMSVGLSVFARFSISALVAEPSLIQVKPAALPVAGSMEKSAPTLAAYSEPEDRSLALSATNTK
ncbi:hypothetical protein D3C72_2178240 [compost metagenome]